MVEQLVAAGACHAITDNNIFTANDALSRIPAILRKRMFVVDPQESHEMTSAILKPILNELGIEEDLRGTSLKPSVTANEGLVHLAATVYFALPDFFLACREQLQLDFPLEPVRMAIDHLLLHAREPQARGNLVTLAGIFGSYQRLNVDSLESRSVISDDHSSQLMDLIEDERYRMMSAAAWEMGIPEKVNRAFVVFSRCARRVANSRMFKPLVNLTSKVVTAGVKIPMPDSEIGSLIAKQGFMPPIVPLDSLRQGARDAYIRANPPVLMHPNVKDRGA